MLSTSNQTRQTLTLLAAALIALAAAPPALAGWLGVQLQSAPPPLAAHFNLADGGLMVENVIPDGPAHRAGLDRWDIITALDGQPVSDLAAFTAAIQSKAAGQTVTVAFIHAGQAATATVTLDERPDPIADLEWKYDWEPRDILEERIRVRGHTLTQDDKGNWMLRDILDLPQPAPLPHDLKSLFDGITMKVLVSTDEQGEHITIKREESDGRKVEVTVQGDEPIVVRRTEIVGDQESTTETTYADLDALRQEDPEAADMLSGTQDRCMIEIGPSAPGGAPRALKLDTRVHPQDPLGHANKALADYLSALSGKLGSCSINLGAGKGLQGLQGPFCLAQESRFSFRVQPDGQIEVTRRGGDADLTDVYRDEADLETRDPSMYQRYRSLREPTGPADPP